MHHRLERSTSRARYIPRSAARSMLLRPSHPHCRLSRVLPPLLRLRRRVAKDTHTSHRSSNNNSSSSSRDRDVCRIHRRRRRLLLQTALPPPHLPRPCSSVGAKKILILKRVTIQNFPLPRSLILLWDHRDTETATFLVVHFPLIDLTSLVVEAVVQIQ